MTPIKNSLLENNNPLKMFYKIIFHLESILSKDIFKFILFVYLYIQNFKIVQFFYPLGRKNDPSFLFLKKKSL